EAEFDWLAKALTDIPTARTIEWLKRSEHNILPRLRREAKASNDAKLAQAIADDNANGGALDLEKQAKQFKQRMGYGFKVVKDALDAGLQVPAGLGNAASAIQTGQRTGEAPFALLAWTLDNDTGAHMGRRISLEDT